ncbi:MAG: fumarate reductase/succinate dehydrogenase flavoprotein domain protein [Firmicutes bacterium]|nr:fumarate reductase/succinate dehydrogenase flavoprotein domain protein [Bacillota bacterium]
MKISTNLDKEFFEEVSYGNTQKTKCLECDVAVVGAGGSGIVAAVRAAECGAKVIVIDKAGRAGGNAWMAVGMFATNSKKHQRAGYEDTTDQVFLDAMNATRWATDPKIVRTYIENSGKFADWLENKGMEFELIAFDPNKSLIGIKERRSHHKVTDPSHGPGFMGSTVVETMLEECKKHDIQILTKTKVTKVLVDEAGKVNGVLATSQSEEIRVAAKSVILAAGGFGANKEMLKKHFPNFFGVDGMITRLSLGHSTGDGITMAGEAGAVTGENMGVLLFGPSHHPWSYRIHNLLRRPHCLWVNKEGKRFMPETVEFDGANAMVRQPETILYGIIDEATKNFIMKEDTGCENEQMSNTREYMALLDIDLKREAAGGKTVKIADTIEDLARFIGAKPSVLQATIERYNACWATGYDKDFQKDKKYLRPIGKAPFYAILGVRCYDTTHGGIKINERLEVINKKGNVIGGLYATGDNASGWVTQDYGPIAASLTWCFNSGFMAGEHAAGFALGK